MDNINRVTVDYVMKINVKKTNMWCISRRGKCKVKIYIDGRLIEQIQQFRHLGSLIREDGYCDKEIRCTKRCIVQYSSPKQNAWKGRKF